MLQFRNHTGFAGMAFAAPDVDGIDSVHAVVKGTFRVGQVLEPAAEQLPVATAPQYHGEPGRSSLRVASDISLMKPATDVLLCGHAYGAGGRPAYYVDVSLAVGPVRKSVRVFGNRYWSRAGVGYTASAPEPFEAMPLVWERAFGGTDATGGQVEAEPRNPVGVGFRARGGDVEIEGTPLPNLEDPYDPITSWKQRPAPAGFGPIDGHWEPRRSFAGTYDEAWQQSRAPYLPHDFDPRFFQVAPPGLVAPGHLEGSEAVEVLGATPDGVLRFRLPGIRIQITFVIGGARQVRGAVLDTVSIEPDQERVVLVWRAALQCDKQVLRVDEIIAARASG